jgi:hypothetical protein
VSQLRFQFKEWNEHEGALGYARMWQRQGRRLHRSGAVQQDIDIQRARPFVSFPGTIPAEFRFYSLCPFQEVHGTKISVTGHDQIKEIRLVKKVPGRGPID